MKSSKPIVLFGAGKIGKKAAQICQWNGKTVAFFIDNDKEKWGKKIQHIPVVSLEEFLSLQESYQLLVACGLKHRDEILRQLSENGVKNFAIFDAKEFWKLGSRETVVSFSHTADMEDVILYQVFHDIDDVFYIDVGANDPDISSVTRLFYTGGGHGINIEPIPEMVALYKSERPRDITLCVGAGKKRETKTLYLQGMASGEVSTTLESNRISQNVKTLDIDIVPLKDICDKYLDAKQEIHFLKVDVEGAEKEVLEGADLESYRPWCIVMESTLPCTDIPCYMEWEPELLNHCYHLAYTHGVNRYYIADEHQELDERFLPFEELMKKYRVFHAELVN